MSAKISSNAALVYQPSLVKAAKYFWVIKALCASSHILHRSAKVDVPSCENVAGNLKQKW